MTGVGYRKSWF